MIFLNKCLTITILVHVVAQLVQALRYKPGGRGFDYLCYLWNFSLKNILNCAKVLRSTQPLSEMSTRNISWEVKAAGTQGGQPYNFHNLKSGRLNFLEPSGPVQAGTGTTSHLPFTVTIANNVHLIIAIQPISLGIKKKLKAVCGSYSTAALRHIVLLPE